MRFLLLFLLFFYQPVLADESSPSARRYIQLGFKGLNSLDRSAKQSFTQVCTCVSPCFLRSAYVSAINSGGHCLIDIHRKDGYSLLANGPMEVNDMEGSYYLPLAANRVLRPPTSVIIEVIQLDGSTPLDLSVGLTVELEDRPIGALPPAEPNDGDNGWSKCGPVTDMTYQETKAPTAEMTAVSASVLAK